MTLMGVVVNRGRRREDSIAAACGSSRDFWRNEPKATRWLPCSVLLSQDPAGQFGTGKFGPSYFRAFSPLPFACFHFCEPGLLSLLEKTFLLSFL
jgi:hypothetical protein